MFTYPLLHDKPTEGKNSNNFTNNTNTRRKTLTAHLPPFASLVPPPHSWYQQAPPRCHTETGTQRSPSPPRIELSPVKSIRSTVVQEKKFHATQTYNQNNELFRCHKPLHYKSSSILKNRIPQGSKWQRVLMAHILKGRDRIYKDKHVSWTNNLQAFVYSLLNIHSSKSFIYFVHFSNSNVLFNLPNDLSCTTIITITYNCLILNLIRKWV